MLYRHCFSTLDDARKPGRIGIEWNIPARPDEVNILGKNVNTVKKSRSSVRG
jgi:hypothetical protein